MKREAILKTILVLIIGVVLFARPVNVFAVSSNPTDLNDFWEDQGSMGDIQKEENKKEETTTPSTQTPSTTTKPDTETTKPNTQTNTNTNTNTNKPTTNTTNKTDIPKAGLVEDTVMVVTILAFIAVAVFAFVKISDYSNI